MNMGPRVSHALVLALHVLVAQTRNDYPVVIQMLHLALVLVENASATMVITMLKQVTMYLA